MRWHRRNIPKMPCSRIAYANGDDIPEKHRLLTDIEFMDKMADASLEPASFTHEAHIRLAWLTMDTLGFEASVEAIAACIAKFDRKHGDGQKFDPGITLAASKLIWDCKSNSASANFHEFLDEFPGLKARLRALSALHGHPGN
jgi:hypothetical protein